MDRLVLSKQDLYDLTGTRIRESQMEQLDAWGIPYELTLSGQIKVLHRDLVWSAERSEMKGPDYDAA